MLNGKEQSRQQQVKEDSQTLKNFLVRGQQTRGQQKAKEKSRITAEGEQPRKVSCMGNLCMEILEEKSTKAAERIEK